MDVAVSKPAAVYFFDRCDGTGKVRIGYDNSRRTAVHRNEGNALLAIMPGTKPLEDVIHEDLAAEKCAHGNSWFLGPRVDAYIERLLAFGYASDKESDLQHLAHVPIDAVRPTVLLALPLWEEEDRQFLLLPAAAMQGVDKNGLDARARRLERAAAVKLGRTTSKTDEWYTPLEYVDRARRALGGEIDLDPASCHKANRRIRALGYYSETASGLDVRRPWRGRVWMNPPYGDLAPEFARRLVREYAAGHVTAACALFDVRHTSALWFVETIYPTVTALGVTRGRLQFEPGREGQIRGAQQPSAGHIVVYFGPAPDAFRCGVRGHAVHLRAVAERAMTTANEKPRGPTKARGAEGVQRTAESVTAAAAPVNAAPAAEWVHIHELVPWADNPRTRTAEDVAELAREIRTLGFGAPIVARAADLEIIKGHGRRLALLHIWATEPGWVIEGAPGAGWVPVRLLDCDAPTAHRLARADNRLAERSEWDLARLVVQIEAEQKAGGDLSEEGWREGELERLLKQVTAPPLGEGATGTPEEKLAASYNATEVRQLVLYFDPAGYAAFVARLDRLRSELGLETNTAVLQHLVERST